MSTEFIKPQAEFRRGSNDGTWSAFTVVLPKDANTTLDTLPHVVRFTIFDPSREMLEALRAAAEKALE